MFLGQPLEVPDKRSADETGVCFAGDIVRTGTILIEIRLEAHPDKFPELPSNPGDITGSLSRGITQTSRTATVRERGRESERELCDAQCRNGATL